MAEEQLELLTVTDSGHGVPRRLASAAAARNLYKEYEDLDNQSAFSRSVIQGMIDGNQPYDPQMLEEQGLGSMVNVNFLSMRANLDARAAASHEIFAEVPTLIEVNSRSNTDGDFQAQDNNSIISEEFTRTVRDWKKFLPYMDLTFRESDAYGIGVCLFPNEYDWRFKAFRRGSLRFDADASVDVDENDIYFLKDTMSAVDLLGFIDAEDAAKSGWDVKACRELLIDIFIVKDEDDEDRYPMSSWESLQQMKNNNDTSFQTKQYTRVPFVHILTKEAGTGSITHQMLAENLPEAEEKFMFEKHDRFEAMRHNHSLPLKVLDFFALSLQSLHTQNLVQNFAW